MINSKRARFRPPPSFLPSAILPHSVHMYYSFVSARACACTQAPPPSTMKCLQPLMVQCHGHVVSCAWDEGGGYVAMSGTDSALLLWNYRDKGCACACGRCGRVCVFLVVFFLNHDIHHPFPRTFRRYTFGSRNVSRVCTNQNAAMKPTTHTHMHTRRRARAHAHTPSPGTFLPVTASAGGSLIALNAQK